MKTALITWFHHLNYGSALQVSALSKVINEMGHDVQVINYISDVKPVSLRKDNLLVYCAKKLIGKKRLRFSTPHESLSKKLLYKVYYLDTLKLTSPCVTLSDFKALNDEFDCFVCGSDQIWAPSVHNPRYFLDFVADPKCTVAYAPSVGMMNIDDPDVKAHMASLAGRIEHLSTREESGSKMISELTGRSVKTVLDPTLLISAERWREMSEPIEPGEEPYMLVYFLRYNKKYLNTVYKLAKKLSLKVKLIPVLADDIKRNGCIDKPVGPREFLSLIDNASFICTDSFHGMAFSINFKKPFLIFERFSKSESINQNSRIYNLLSICKLEERLYNGKNAFSVAASDIDYSSVSLLLDAQIKESRDFLKSALDSVAEYNELRVKDHSLIGNDLCCGCGACVSVCPKNAIKITETDGFFTAETDKSKCVSCGKCVSVCPFYNSDSGVELKKAALYSFKANCEKTLNTSSSGGAAHVLSTELCAEGSTVIGCTYVPEKHRAEHIAVLPNDIECLKKLQGSKYMQSNFSKALEFVKQHNEPTVIFGTPCQIAGARAVLAHRDNVKYVDLICHGVPTYNVFDKYLEYIGRVSGVNTSNAQMICRYKEKGWAPFYLYSTDGDKKYCRVQSKDPYFAVFESGFCYSKACYECRWRASSQADIRLGDYWGEKFKNDKQGVSMVLSFTPDGAEMIKLLEKFGITESQPIADYSVQQTENFPAPFFRDRMIKDYAENNKTIEELNEKYVGRYTRETELRRSVSKIKKAVKKHVK